ncbi:MAG: type II methionyl aminopeptidase [Nanoarchaeota archaeon]
MNNSEKEDLLLAGKISKEVKEYIKTIIKKDKLLIEIAEQIESKISDLRGQIAFPVNLGINEIAAHHTPAYNDEETAKGLLKVDFGVSINGFTADSAISFDLENSEENKILIKTAEESLKKAIELVSKDKTKTKINEIGLTIEKTAEKYKLQPITNLSGHSIEKYDLHAGVTIPNTDNSNKEEIGKGIFAIEPFITLSSANGKVYDSKPSGIYHLIERKPVRDPNAREILDFIEKEYKTLPFCSRWLIKKFGTKALIALRQLEQTDALHHYEELVEQAHKPVAQAECTLLIEDNEVIIVN